MLIFLMSYLLSLIIAAWAGYTLMGIKQNKKTLRLIKQGELWKTSKKNY